MLLNKITIFIHDHFLFLFMTTDLPYYHLTFIMKYCAILDQHSSLINKLSWQVATGDLSTDVLVTPA